MGVGVWDQWGNFRYYRSDYKGFRKSNNLMWLQIHFNIFMYTEYLRCLIKSYCNTSLLFSTELCVLLTMCTCTFQHNIDIYNHIYFINKIKIQLQLLFHTHLILKYMYWYNNKCIVIINSRHYILFQQVHYNLSSSFTDQVNYLQNETRNKIYIHLSSKSYL